MSQPKTPVSLKNIPLKHWVLYAGYLLIFGLCLWQFILPFLAERKFRDGYNFGAGKRYQLAIEDLETALTYAPWETHYMVQLGKYYEDYGKKLNSKHQKMAYFQKAEDLYVKMTKLDPLNPWYRNRVAVINMAKAKADKPNASKYRKISRDNIKKAAELDSQNPLFQLNWASYLHKTGELDKAIPIYKRVISYDARIGEAYFNLADIARKQGDLEATLDYYEQIYKINPTFSNVPLAIASTLMQLKRKKDAIPYLEESLEIKKQLNAQKSLAALYYQEKMWKKAATLYESILTEYENQDQFHGYYVHALVSSGQLEKAHKSLTNYLKTYPDNAQAKKQFSAIDKIVNKKRSN